MPKRGLRAEENSSCKITFGNQRINHLQCCGYTKACFPEESGGMENLFENRQWKATRMKTNLKLLKKSKSV